MTSPASSKLIAIVVVIACLALGLSRIGDIVDDRSKRQDEAELSVALSQAGRQTLLGPVLQRFCVEEWDVVNGTGDTRTVTVSKREFALTAIPDHLQVDAKAASDVRHRGLFHVNTYTVRSRLAATWPSLGALDPAQGRSQPDSRLRCSEPTLVVALTDARGILAAHVTAAGLSYSPQPGTPNKGYPLGFHAALAGLATDRPASVEVDLELLGTGQLSFAPVAAATEVHLASDWPHPSFGGRFLPAERSVTPKGFDATWRVSSLATAAPAHFQQGVALCAMPFANEMGNPAHKTPGCVESFGVAFFDPINPYVLSNRAVKYGLLFIGLTFVAVAMVEVLQRRRVHPVQYLLVGCALSVFFLLLLSLSEHLAFGVAYGIASLACCALLTVYAGHALGGWRAGGAFGAGVAGLYGALYVLLQQEQTALVLGSLLLFAVLAAVMLATRNLDWYAVLGSGKPAKVPAA